MDAGLAAARQAFAARLVSAFAIGSLAHGGFAPAASDVDLALILAELKGDEPDRVRQIGEAVRQASLSPLAGRLSVFWSSWEALKAGSGAGRFPLADRQDLAAAGVCLFGHDERARIALPSGEAMRRALIVEGARFMLEKLATPERNALLKDPEALVALGCRDVTKAVLFPARFLFTAHAGRPAGNEEAAQYVARSAEGPVGDLALAAFGWRNVGRLDDGAAAALSAGLLPLHGLLTQVYRAELDSFGEAALAEAVEGWGKDLAGAGRLRRFRDDQRQRGQGGHGR